jgi:hypothetical protein
MNEETSNESNEQLTEEEFFPAANELAKKRTSDMKKKNNELRIHESQAKWFPYR